MDFAPKATDKYFYCREHNLAEGWSVRGKDFSFAVPDKTLAFAISHLLNGRPDQANSLVKNIEPYLQGVGHYPKIKETTNA